VLVSLAAAHRAVTKQYEHRENNLLSNAGDLMKRKKKKKEKEKRKKKKMLT
jgi:hypothetical protein